MLPQGYADDLFASHIQCCLMCIMLPQAYEGLQTAHKLKQEYVFLPAKLKEVYLTYLLEHLEDHKVMILTLCISL